MRDNLSFKSGGLLIVIAALAAAGLLWWLLIGSDPAARATVETVPPGYNPFTGQPVGTPPSAP